MKAIVIKLNDKVVFCEQVDEITTAKYINLKKEVAETWNFKEQQINELKNKIESLQSYCDELNAKVNYLGKQIAIDRGEIESDNEEEYELVLVNHEEEQEEEPTEEIEE